VEEDKVRQIVVWIVLFVFGIEDWKKKRISLPGLTLFLAGGVLSQIWEEQNDCGSLLLSLIPGGVLLLLAFAAPEGLGTGDGLVLLGIGLFLPWQQTLALLAGALALSSAWGILLMLRHRGGRKTTLPFVPFLWLAFSIGGIVFLIAA